MSDEIDIGTLVVIPQGVVRRVVRIENGRAIVRRTDNKGPEEGPFELGELKVERPRGPLRPAF